jgi:DNA-directed RNA polymerase subunit M/transcription elongation factor TFIIS
MDVKATCPNCGQHLVVDSAAIGQQTNCPTCSTPFDFASLTINNISYQLRTGTNVNESHPEEILAVDPINGIVLHCDGTVERDWHYKKKDANN